MRPRRGRGVGRRTRLDPGRASQLAAGAARAARRSPVRHHQREHGAHPRISWRGEPLSVFVLPHALRRREDVDQNHQELRPRSCHLVGARSHLRGARAWRHGGGPGGRLLQNAGAIGSRTHGTGTTTDDRSMDRGGGRCVRSRAADGAVDDHGAREPHARPRRNAGGDRPPPRRRARARLPNSISSSRT